MKSESLVAVVSCFVRLALFSWLICYGTKAEREERIASAERLGWRLRPVVAQALNL